MKRHRHYLFLTLLCCFALCACGSMQSPISSRAVHLSDYVVVELEGTDGCGTASINVDFERILDDNRQYLEKELDANLFGAMTPEGAFRDCFINYNPFVPSYDGEGELSNGDSVVINWNTSSKALELLEKVIHVEFVCDSITVPVQGLTPIKEIDPFEHLCFIPYGTEYEGYISDAVVQYFCEVHNQVHSLEVDFDDTHQREFATGDTITFSIKESDLSEQKVKSRKESCGITFARTSAEITLGEGDFQLPRCLEGREILEYLTQEDIDGVTEGILKIIKKAQEDPERARFTVVEYVGLAYYYEPKPELYKSFNWNNGSGKSRLVFFFRVDDGTVPGGWYTYVSPLHSAYIVLEMKRAGNGYYMMNQRIASNPYGAEFAQMNGGVGVSNSDYESVSHWLGSHTVIEDEHVFQYNNTWYAGHLSLEEAIKTAEETIGLGLEFKLYNYYLHVIYDGACADIRSDK